MVGEFVVKLLTIKKFKKGIDKSGTIGYNIDIEKR